MLELPGAPLRVTQSVWSSVLFNMQDVDGWMDCCIRAASYQVARLLGGLQEIAIVSCRASDIREGKCVCESSHPRRQRRQPFFRTSLGVAQGRTQVPAPWRAMWPNRRKSSYRSCRLADLPPCQCTTPSASWPP